MQAWSGGLCLLCICRVRFHSLLLWLLDLRSGSSSSEPNHWERKGRHQHIWISYIKVLKFETTRSFDDYKAHRQVHLWNEKVLLMMFMTQLASFAKHVSLMHQLRRRDDTITYQWGPSAFSIEGFTRSRSKDHDFGNCNKFFICHWLLLHTQAIPNSWIQQQDSVSGGKHRLCKLFVGLPGDGVSHSESPQVLSSHMAVHSRWVKEQALVSLHKFNLTANTADASVLACTWPSTVRPIGTSEIDGGVF